MKQTKRLLGIAFIVGTVFSAAFFISATETGRREFICPTARAWSGLPLDDASIQANLSLIGRPFAIQPPKPRLDWVYLPLAKLVVPLPSGDWQRFEPESTSTLFQAESADVKVRVDTYPYRFDDAAAKMNVPTWLSFLLGSKLSRIKQPIIAAFRRDLSQGCDPKKDIKSIFIDALLTEIKAVSTNSGRAIAARWNRAPSRFMIAYENGTKTTIRYTQKAGQDATVIVYETKSSSLAQEILEQLELAAKIGLATPPPQDLTKISHSGSHSGNAFEDIQLRLPREMCSEFKQEWEAQLEEEEFFIDFSEDEKSLSKDALNKLETIRQVLDKKPGKIVIYSKNKKINKDPDAITHQQALIQTIQAWVKRKTGATALIDLNHSQEIQSNHDLDGIIIKISPQNTEFSKEESTRLISQLTQALDAPLRSRLSYIKSRRRGEESPVIGLLPSLQKGPYSINLDSLPESLKQLAEQKKLVISSLSGFSQLTYMTRRGIGIPVEVAQNLKDCMAIDFLLVPILINTPHSERKSGAFRLDFTVHLIELSTLDLVGSWTSIHTGQTETPEEQHSELVQIKNP